MSTERTFQRVGYRAVDIATTTQNTTFIAWAGNDTTILLTILDSNGNTQGEYSYCPNPNWHVKALAPGLNNTVYMLLSSVDSGTWVGQMRTDGGVESTAPAVFYPMLFGHRQNKTAGGFPDTYLPTDIATRGDGKVLILFTQRNVTKPDRRAIISTYDQNNIAAPLTSDWYGYSDPTYGIWRPTGLVSNFYGETGVFYNLKRGDYGRLRIYRSYTPNNNYFYPLGDYDY